MNGSDVEAVEVVIDVSTCLIYHAETTVVVGKVAAK